MQREAKLIATIRAKLLDFTRMCADGSELVMLHQEAFAADYKKTSTCCLGWTVAQCLSCSRWSQHSLWYEHYEH